MSANVKLVDNKGRPRGVLFNHHDAPVVVDYISNGLGLGYTYFVLNSIEDLDQNHSFDLLFQVGATPVNIVTIEGQADGVVHGYLYEGTEVSVLGTEVTPHCANRILNISSTVKLYGGSTETNGMTITNVGTMLMSHHFPGSTGPFSLGVSGSANADLVLNPNTNYLFRLDNETVADRAVMMHLVWMEF